MPAGENRFVAAPAFSSQMIEFRWSYVLIAFLLYWIAVVALDNRGFWERHDMSAVGPMVMIRTFRGKQLLERLAEPKRFWRVYGNIGVAIAGLVGAVSFFFLLQIGYMSIVDTPPATDITEPQNVLVVPGLNEFLPLSMAPEIILGLLIGIVVHEGGHGVLCRVEDIEVDSMGAVMLAVLPMGAFVEPDEEGVEEADSGGRTRMFAAGVMANFVVTLVVFLALATAMGAVSPVDGVGVQLVQPDTAGEEAGIQQGDVIQTIDGETLQGFDDYLDRIENASGEVVLGVYRDGEVTERTLYLDESEGVRLSVVQQGEAAYEAGLREDDAVTSIDGEPTSNVPAFQSALSGLRPGDEVSVTYLRDDVEHETSVTLGEHPADSEQGFLGVNFLTRSEEVGVTPYDIEGPYSLLASYDPRDWVVGIFLPLGIMTSQFFGFDGFVLGFYELTGAAAALGGVYWFALNLMYWTAWVNFNLGLFNCIPALPLDGGHLLREASDRAIAASGALEEAAADRVSDAFVVTVTLVMFGSMVLMIAAPRLL